MNISGADMAKALMQLECDGWTIVNVFTVGPVVMAAVKRPINEPPAVRLDTVEGLVEAATRLGMPESEVEKFVDSFSDREAVTPLSEILPDKASPEVHAIVENELAKDQPGPEGSEPFEDTSA